MAHLETASDVWKFVDKIKRRFNTRNTKWGDRRKVRFRRMEHQLSSLPLNPEIKETALMIHQSEAPNQEVHKRTKRLVANKPRFEVVITENEPDKISLAQALEDGVKALYKWLNTGTVPFDYKSTTYQQGDGLGIGRVDFLPDHGVTLKEFDPESLETDESDEDSEDLVSARKRFNEVRGGIPEGDEDEKAKVAYDIVTEDALKKERPPFRFVAVDPLTCYWWEDEEGRVEIMVEMGKKAINPLLESFSDYGLTLNEEKTRFTVSGTGMPAIGGFTAPGESPDIDIPSQVSYVEVRTRQEIIILIEHPKIKDRRTLSKMDATERGVMLRFPNPFGPYSTGYVLIPGDVTGEADPADAYQPPVLGMYNTAQALNVLTTAHLSAGLQEALAPRYIEVAPSEAPVGSLDEEDKSPERTGNQELPQIPGKIRRVDTPNIDLEKAEGALRDEEDQYRIRDALVGDATADTSGHRLAIQVAQADIQMVPYQNAREAALTELMKCVIYAIRKHGLSVYIPTLPDGARSKDKLINITEPAVITPEMGDLPFDLRVKLGAETAITKFAKWQALQEREDRGTLGYQTVMEESDVENPEDEIVRVFEGKMLKLLMEAQMPEVIAMLKTFMQARLQAALQAPTARAGRDEFAENPASGRTNGGGGSSASARDIARSPGRGMPLNQTQSVAGRRVPAGAGDNPLGG